MKSIKTKVIAEAGVNHNGSIKTAKELIEVASKCGADYVKFQTFKADNLLSKNAEKAHYQIINTDSKESQFEMLKKLELSKNDHEVLIEHCLKNNIGFLSTPFDIESLEMLINLDISIIKIPSGEITNFPFLKYISFLDKELIVSTGMSNMDEISSAMKVLLSGKINKNSITILQCNTEYPTPIEDVNLKAMNTIMKKFNTKVGYSDHTLGIDVPIAAVALGASIIEKHFTLDRKMVGPDHSTSLVPGELCEMIKSIRRIEKALGNGQKSPSKSEIKNMIPARKSIVAKTKIQVGETFSSENISVKRPGDGISPMEWGDIIGRKSRFNFKPDEKIKL